jgi:hypothetical protein
MKTLRIIALAIMAAVLPAIAQDNPVTNLKVSGTFSGTPSSGTLNLSGLTVTLASPSIAVGINAQTGTTYTSVLADAAKVVTMTNASANTFTVPPHSSVAFPIGAQLLVEQGGAGITTIAAGAGVAIHANGGVLTTTGQYALVQLIQTATDVWTAQGSFGPGGLAGTSLSVLGTTGPQVTWGYSGGVNVTQTQGSNGYTIYDLVGAGLKIWEWRIDGNTNFNILTGGAIVAVGSSAAYGVNGVSASAGRVIYSVDNNSGNGAGLSYPATAQLGFCIGASEKMTLSATLLSSAVAISVPTHTPSSASDAGVAGTITWDASFVYVCTATNTWKRVAIATW